MTLAAAPGEDSSAGGWPALDAITESGLPPMISTVSHFARFVSRRHDSLTMSVAAALRNESGGHAVTKE
ncbi:MAG: hypothetical protein ACE5FA_00540 [Dehalococcoidia bacterium]